MAGVRFGNISSLFVAGQRLNFWLFLSWEESSNDWVKICLSLKTVCCSLLPCSHTGSYRINPNTSEFQLPLAVQRMTPTKASGWGMVILQPSNDPRTKSSLCRTSGPYLYSLRENYHKLHSNLGYSVRMSQNKQTQANSLTSLHTGELSLWLLVSHF